MKAIRIVTAFILIPASHFSSNAMAGSEIVLLELTCPAEIRANFTPVSSYWLKLNRFPFKSSRYTSSGTSGGYAECTYQYTNYVDSKVKIWHYCGQGINMRKVSDRKFKCYKLGSNIGRSDFKGRNRPPIHQR